MTVSRIWDFRRGDADDNRTSPYGRGFWSVVFSALIDFNILKASLAFLMLIVGPALLVGASPSAALYLGRLKLQMAGFAGTHPALMLILFAALAGAAFWIGRPIFSAAVDYFWHLHYSLVFPIFVALREALRLVAERIPGRPASAQQLHRRRQAGSILAALLLAAGGAGLAWAIGVSFGLHFLEAGQVRPWAVVKAALGNAAVVLGISTVIESGYWLWHEFKLSGPVLDWNPTPAGTDSPLVRVAHLSDLHVVSERFAYRMESGTLGPRGNRCILRALRKLAAIQESSPVDRILVTGDVTDAGTRSEWAEFVGLLREHPDLRARMSFVPGNHDVNIVDRAHPALFDLPWSTGQALRKLREDLALDEIQGDRAYLVDRASGAPGPLLRDYLRKGNRADLLRELAQRGSARGRREIDTAWKSIFPLVEPATEHGYGLILLNSNAPSHFSLTSAVGVIDRSQLRALRSILRNSANQPWLVLLHHQVVEYPLTCISLRDRIGLALINAPDVLATLAPYASRILVLHGHRHRDWVGTCSGVVLCSAPSASLGSYGGEMYQGSFRVHEFALGRGEIQLTATEQVKVGGL